MTATSTEVSIPENTPALVNPAEVLEQATKAAQALQGVIAKKPQKVMIGGNQYLEFEDWQTLGRFYGITVGVVETKEIWRNEKLLGFSATAKAKQGNRGVSQAEASCMRDEPNWMARPEFMLKSMAQTRACAKALRNVLAWVAVLAGFKGTPAEEMEGVIVKQEVVDGRVPTSMKAYDEKLQQQEACPHENVIVKQASGAKNPANKGREYETCAKCGAFVKWVKKEAV